MRALVLGLVVAFPALLLAACPGVTPVTPGPDADAAPAPILDARPPLPPTAACTAACAALAAAGCAEGTTPTCASTLTRIDADRLFRMPSGAPLTCVVLEQVTSAAQVRADGIACVDAP